MRKLILTVAVIEFSVAAWAQNIGIGTNTPQARLHLQGNGFPESFMYLQANAGQDAGFRIYEGETVKWHIFNQASLGGFHIYNNAVQTALFLKQSNAFVGIGTNAPQARLDVNGQIRMTGGSPGLGKILTSDASGVASWQMPAYDTLTLPFAGTTTTAGYIFSLTCNGGLGLKSVAWGPGVTGESTSPGGIGVYGKGVLGIYGSSEAETGTGVRGYANSVSGTTYGVKGEGASPTGYGVYGINYSTTGTAIGVYGDTYSSTGIGVYGATATTGNGKAIYGIANSTGYAGYFLGGQVYIDTKLGIGKGAAYPLDVVGTANLNNGIPSGIALRCNGDEALWYDGTYFSWGYAGAYNFIGNKLRIGGNGNIAPAYTLYVDGTAAKSSAGTAWVVSSDARLKSIRGNYGKGLREIMHLQPVQFTYLPNNARQLNATDVQVGFVAQDVQKYFPEAVIMAKDGYLDFDMHPLSVAVFNAIKELKAENDQLKARLEKLEKLLKQ